MTISTGKSIDTFADLRAQLAGEVIASNDAGYDAARKVWNGMIDRHPAAIARCAGVSDVLEAVKYARANDLVHWQTTLLADPSRAPRDRLVSAGVVQLPDAPLGVTSAVLARDPDGHVLEFASQQRAQAAVTGEMR